MKTRDRILQTSLALFNELGEGAVSTNHIADEMEISPGNLYYHFRNKDQIVAELYDQFHASASSLLDVPENITLELEDVWLFLHLVLEKINDFRFFYNNMTDILRRLKATRRQFGFLLEAKRGAAIRLCRLLRNSGQLQASDKEIEDLSINLVMVATYWTNFQSSRTLPSTLGNQPGNGAYQVMSLLTPFLREPERSHLNQLAEAYRR
ncbi:MAG: TetR/AcrR family transcriptional regulator [Lysobacterales bacterium]